MDTGRPVLGTSPVNLLSTDAFTGTLVGANLKAPLRLEAAVTDSAGKVHPVPLKEIPKLKAGDMIKLEYAIPAGNLADGECRIEFRANGEPLAGYAVKKADLIKQQSARLDAALRRLETLRRELANEKSEYVRLPLNVLGDFLPRFRERMDRAGDKRLHAERLLMVMPDAEAALDDLERLAGELKRGRKLPGDLALYSRTDPAGGGLAEGETAKFRWESGGTQRGIRRLRPFREYAAGFPELPEIRRERHPDRTRPQEPLSPAWGKTGVRAGFHRP